MSVVVVGDGGSSSIILVSVVNICNLLSYFAPSTVSQLCY